jgi:hypothetical protein
VEVIVVRGEVEAMATVVLVVLVVVSAKVVVTGCSTVVVELVVAVGVTISAADITALQSTDWYLGCVLWSMRPSKGRR